MSANDKTEKVLRELHILLSKSEPYKKEPTKVIVDKQKMLDLLSDLNKCIYEIQDEYELTEQSRAHAEREFRKKGDQIVWDASRKAEDVYAASVMYTDDALNRVLEIIHATNESMFSLYDQMNEKIKEQEHLVKSNQLELKSQLQDLSDTEKYLKIIEDRNREIQRQKDAGKPKKTLDNEASIYANRRTEIKVNKDYIRKLGLDPDEVSVDEADTQVKYEKPVINVNPVVNTDQKEQEEKEAELKADLDAEYFNWKEEAAGETKPGIKESNDLAEGIQKMWKSITGSRK